MQTDQTVVTEGVIYQASYRVLGGHPVVHLYGTLIDGDSFLIRDHGHTPHFFVRAADAERVRNVGAHCAAQASARNFGGEAVCRVDVSIPADVPSLRDRLHSRGIDTYEADVRFAYRMLIDQGIKGGVQIHGIARPGLGAGTSGGQGTRWIFDDPQLSAATVSIAPRVLAFDIETDPHEDRLLAISVYGCDHAEVLICDPKGRALPPGCRGFPDERSTLVAFVRLLVKLDPDVLTGWNVIDFDLSMLMKVARRTGVNFELGREAGPVRLRAAEGYFGSSSVTIAGRIVLDGVDLLRGAFVRMESYSLDAVARAVLGEGKVLEGDVKDRVGEILHRYHNDLPGFAAYSLADSRLVIDILAQLKLIDLAFERSRLTGMMPDRVAASIASFDFLYLTELQRRSVVAPTLRIADPQSRVAQAGGEVFEPVPGLYENVWVFDFKSLYPSIIRTFNIDPLGFVAPVDAAADESLIEVAGAHFRRTPGILPGMLDELFPRREAAKASGDEVASQAIKILMNSFYGVLGTSACRFCNPQIANAITGQGRLLLRWARDWFAERGLRVLYGDTDSLFVLAAEASAGAAIEQQGAELAQALNRELSAQISAQFQVPSRLELEFEKLYGQLFLPALRGGTGGARKRYVGVRRGELEFVGMEVVRRDWTELAKRAQRQLYQRLFEGRDISDYLGELVQDLRAGRLDELLVYRKGLRKPAAEYTANTPPHVQAARKSPTPAGSRARRIIEYVMTTDGPEPLDNRRASLDLEHYVEKQLRPVAQPVLDTLGLKFEQVVGDDTQLGLF
ncbi:MAG: DNA polymerase II [Pseudomonadales bacterium]